jgi:proteasome-associated ATPase
MSDGSIHTGVIPSKTSTLFKVGTAIQVIAETGAIQKIEPGGQLGVGPLNVVAKVLDASHVEVESEAGRKVMLVAWDVKDLKPGCRVLVDRTDTVITKNLGIEIDKFKVTENVNVAWNQIGGLTEAKQQLREAIELPIKNPEIFKRYGRRPAKGIMLYGPPGCGKTMLAKAAATSIASLHGAKSMSTGFIYVKGPEILSKWVGESEATIRGLFHRAREHFRDHGYPAVVFLDEADAVLGRRGSGRSSDMERTIVPQFLSEMDGMNVEGSPLVLIATNRPETLDPAVVRDGRVDRKIKIERPGKNEVKEIFSINLKNKPTTEKDLADHAAKELMCDSKVLFEISDNRGQKHTMPLSATVNGAMVAGIVDRASALAMRREMSGAGRGLLKNDFDQSIRENIQEMADLDMQDEITAFAETRKFTPTGYSRLAQ